MMSSNYYTPRLNLFHEHLMNILLRNYIKHIEKYRYYNILPMPDLPVILMLETGIAALSPESR
ncbi:MAG: hypothetical protein H6Q64_2462 [Firmicutes bacterium]|nr:hypothetical protein [Bacillota bacterium]